MVKKSSGKGPVPEEDGQRTAREFGRSNTAFEEDENHFSSSPVRTPAKVRQRQQVRSGEALANEFNNAAFEQDDDQQSITPPPPYPCEAATPDEQVSPMAMEDAKTTERETWGSPLEFLLSCIAMSVGLGNVWRFPYTAYKNGGGAFLIPYVIVLLFIGKPLYFLEMAMGQFSSYGSVKVWEVVPILKGVGYGQALATWFVVTYYCVLIAITLFYFFSSFQAVLPWTLCDMSWMSADNCYNSSADTNLTSFNISGLKSSSDLYFNEEVIKKIDSIDDGIGLPDWKLSLCLLLAWILICAILMKGVASSGKVAYFTALFPYVVLITLLVRGVTLEGASDGILYFIRPEWSKLLDANTWYAAVTQCFFSLSVGFGPIVMFSSYNPFRHNIYRDAVIISLMDTFTSFLAGITIFSILGNLAHESGKNVTDVVSAGTGLAFVSYPDAIAKFQYVPQFFAVMFFLMLLTLGIGSAVSLTGCVVTILCDDFPHWKRWLVVTVICLIGFVSGLVYITPGGLIILDIVDYFGGGFIIFLMATIETIGICWIYGLNRFVRDIEFMLGIKLNAYWKITWAYIIPAVLVFIFCYAMATYTPLKEGDYVYPAAATGAGWVLAAIAILQVPLWAAIAIYRQKNCNSFFERIKSSLKETDHWGPKNPAHRLEWKKFQLEKPHHHTSYSARLWYPKVPSRMTYDVSTLSVSNNNPLPAKEAGHQRQKVTSAPHSRSTFENEIAD